MKKSARMLAAAMAAVMMLTACGFRKRRIHHRGSRRGQQGSGDPG